MKVRPKPKQGSRIKITNKASKLYGVRGVVAVRYADDQYGLKLDTQLFVDVVVFKREEFVLLKAKG